MARDSSLCQWERADTGLPCYLTATEVDHIIPGSNHGLSNLQALCRYHHAQKTAQEAAQARAAKRRALRDRGRQNHPGYIRA
ncbi:HNH endonuclease (plasmid) [Streptomyces sp. BI20]|uniref:HNH endonuclease n=1 Tax=Streptomyces sp. BI20 TaxID=3403460 RepID=UPI003C75C4CB